MKRIGKYKIDFVIPLRKNNPLFPSVIEAIVEFYAPRTIYIITPIAEIEKLSGQVSQWKTKDTHIRYIPEETFFRRRYHKHIDRIKKWYTYKDEKSRDFGWWYQQILKIGAVYRIRNLSKPFIVWDADLVPLQKWTLYPSFRIPHFHFALLQETEFNDFNRKQYQESIYDLLKIPEVRPTRFQEEGGTFLTHHFVFYPKVLRAFIRYIEIVHRCTSEKPWFRVILELSDKYYRFSEYKSLATFMSHFFSRKLHYHSFMCYGKNGIQIREKNESQQFTDELNGNIPTATKYIGYREFSHFLFFKYEQNPTYIQVGNLMHPSLSV